jgi:acetyl-CoA acyltransferase
MNVMQQNDARFGLASLCIGVGQGLAVIFERER